MRKKQSVTQRVVLDEDDAPSTKDESQGETDRASMGMEDQEDDLSDSNVSQLRSTEQTSDSHSNEAQSNKDDSVEEHSKESQKPKPMGKESRSESMEQHNLFDEDGNAILPDGTLIIQPTDVDGDRPSSGPVTAPSEGSSLQFDFKDGNPDPKYVISSQSAGGGGASVAGSTSEPGVLDVVKCTTCTTKLNPYHKDDLAVHPVLKVITCKRCMRWYNSVDWSKDEDGKDNQCRWCGEGGQLICCDVCHNTFCKTCIKRNLGRSVLQEIEDLPEDALWRCYVCDQGPLLPLQQGCAQIIEKVEAYRMGKLQRKFKLQNAKKQIENKKPMPVVPTPVTVSVTPVPGIRPQIGVRLTSPSVTPSAMVGPRSSIASTPTNTPRGQFPGRPVHSIPRGPRLPMPMLMNSGMNQRPPGNLMQTNQARYPGSQLGRPPTAVRAMRPGRPPMNVPQNRPQPTLGLNPSLVGGAGSNAATEEWYEQNCSLREILREVNSVDQSNIELALKTTLKELQSWTRKCNHLENELRGALNDAQRRTVVHKFKSTFRLNLLLRLGKIHTLMQKESGLQLAVAAQRSAVMAVQAQSQTRPPNLPTSMMNANAKKMMGPTNRSMVPTIANRGVQPGRMSGGVIDLTEDHSVSANRTQQTMASQGGRVPNFGRPVQHTPATTLNNTNVSSMVSHGRAPKLRRSINSTHVNLLSSDDEDEEKDDGMIDDRNDKTWSGSVSRSSGLRRKSARLAAKSTSMTEGSENEGESETQGTDERVDESDDSQSRLLVRFPTGKRGRKRKKSSGDDDENKKNEEESNENEDSKPAAGTTDENETDTSPVKDEAMEVVLDSFVTESEDKSPEKPVDKPSDIVLDNGFRNENGDVNVITNGVSNSEDITKKEESTEDQSSEKVTPASIEIKMPEEHSGDPVTSEPKEANILDENELLQLNDSKKEEIEANDSSQSVTDTPNLSSEINECSMVEGLEDDSTTRHDIADTCITVSMWGPSDDGSDNGDLTNLKRKASELESGDENPKRQKLDE